MVDERGACLGEMVEESITGRGKHIYRAWRREITRHVLGMTCRSCLQEEKVYEQEGVDFEVGGAGGAGPCGV